MMMTFKATMMFANIAAKLFLTAGVFLIDIQMPVMIKLQHENRRAAYCVVNVT